MAELTNQSIFDTVSTHLFTQGKRSINASGKCMYRGQNNTSCAVGCLISDDLYSSNYEHKGVNEASIQLAFPEFLEHKDLLDCLQQAHDDGSFYDYDTHSSKLQDAWKSTDKMKLLLQHIADKFNIDSSILDGLKFEGR